MADRMSRMLDLLDAFRDHLAAWDLPALASVDVTSSSVADASISAQLLSGRDDMCRLAAGLLAWSATLAEPGVEVLRAETSYHLRVVGQLPDGRARVLVYGGWYGDAPVAGLTPGERRPVAMVVLRRLAELGVVS